MVLSVTQNDGKTIIFSVIRSPGFQGDPRVASGMTVRLKDGSVARTVEEQPCDC